MTDSLLLDGSVPFHRYPGSTTIHRGSAIVFGALPVWVFDPDALIAHDRAVVERAEAGEPNGPLYREAEWAFCILEPGEPGQPTTELRVLAGWRQDDGTFHRYGSAERIMVAFRELVERVY